MEEEVKLFTKVMLTVVGAFGIIPFGLMGSQYLFRHIEDTIKFNRYNEAIQEYRQCAQKYQDEFSVRTYCGDAPSSSILI